MRTGRAEHSGQREFGEPFRFGGTDPGGGRGQLLLGVKQIGAPLEQIRRKSGGHLRRNRLFVQRPAARNRKGFPAEQQAQLIFRLHHLPFKFGGPCRRIGPLRFELIGVQSRGHPLLEPGLSDADGFFPRLQGALRNVELGIELQQVEVAFGHAAHQLQDDGAPILFFREQIRERGLIGPPNAAPEIQFPGKIGLQIIVERVGKAGNEKDGFPSERRIT